MFITPITLVLKVLKIFCGVSSRVATPALAKTRFKYAVFSASFIQFSTAVLSVISRIFVCILAEPCF